ncbi:hypothetical protein L9F63_013409, partial [Diploptera punctata]
KVLNLFRVSDIPLTYSVIGVQLTLRYRDDMILTHEVPSLNYDCIAILNASEFEWFCPSINASSTRYLLLNSFSLPIMFRIMIIIIMYFVYSSTISFPLGLIPAGAKKPRLYSAPKYCVGLAPMQSYMFLVIALLISPL